MDNIFIFHNVGYGLFYTGQIEKYNFVYDCGAVKKNKSDFAHNVQSLNDAIFNYQNNILKSSTIDLIVISHLENHHINGLPKLLNNKSVRKIILPFLPKKIISDCDSLKFLFLLLEIDDDTSKILVDYYHNKPEETDVVILESRETLNSDNWVFNFFPTSHNFGEKTITSFLKESNKFKNNASIDLKGQIEKYKTGYKTLISKIKKSSILMLHYPSIPDYLKNESLIGSSERNKKYLNFYISHQYESVHVCYPPTASLLSADYDYMDSTYILVREQLKFAQYSHTFCDVPQHGNSDQITIDFMNKALLNESNLVICFGLEFSIFNKEKTTESAKWIAKSQHRTFISNEFTVFSYSFKIY